MRRHLISNQQRGLRHEAFVNFIWAGATGASAARQLLGWVSGTSPDHTTFRSKPPSPGRYAKSPPGTLALELLLDKPARPGQTETWIQLFLQLQVSARLDQGKTVSSGQEAGGPCSTGWKAEFPPPGWRHAGSKRSSFRNLCSEIWKPLGGMRGARGGKPSPPVCGITPPGRHWRGEFQNQRAKSGGVRYFIGWTPPPWEFCGAKGPFNDSPSLLPAAWVHTRAPPRAHPQGSCAWARRSQGTLRTHQNPK